MEEVLPLAFVLERRLDPRAELLLLEQRVLQPELQGESRSAREERSEARSVLVSARVPAL
jgi:hypothetical protein